MVKPVRVLHVLVLGALLLGTACSRVPLGVYRIDVQQGNVLSEDMLAQLSPGMERRKVRFLLGTPMLTDTFNQDRWDYIYTYSRGGGIVEQRRVTLFFEDDRLERIEGDVHRGDGRREVTRGETLVLVPEEEDSGGFFETLESGLDLLRPDSETDVGESAAPEGGLQPKPAAEAGDATPQSEEIVRADADDEPTAEPGDGTLEEEEEGWLENVLQYLQPLTSSPREADPGSPSDRVEGRQ